MATRQQINKHRRGHGLAGPKNTLSTTLRIDRQVQTPDPGRMQRAVQEPHRASPEAISQLQRIGGNRAVTRLLQRSGGRSFPRISLTQAGGGTHIQCLYIRKGKGQVPTHYDDAPSDLDKYIKAGQYKGEDLYEQLEDLDIHYGLGSGEYIEDDDIIAAVKDEYFSGQNPSDQEVGIKYQALSREEKLALHKKLAQEGKFPWRFVAQEQYGGTIMEDVEETKEFKDFETSWKMYFHPLFNKKDLKQDSMTYKSGMVHAALNKGHVRFHLDEMGGYNAIQQVLQKQGDYAEAFTSSELRFVRRFWGDVKSLKVPTDQAKWLTEVKSYFASMGKPTSDSDLRFMKKYIEDYSQVTIGEIDLKDHVTFYRQFKPVPAPWTQEYQNLYP